MIDEKLLADPNACPRCAARLSSAGYCLQCGLPLTGPIAERVWQLSVSAAELLTERAWLLGELDRSAQRAHSSPSVVSVPAGAYPTASASAIVHQSPPVTRRETSSRQIRVVLLGLGALLVAVAAVIFAVIAWGSMSIGGRAACLAATTLACVAGAELAARRRLLGTAEAVACVGLVLALLDAYAARRLDVAGLGDGSATRYWAGAFALVAAASAAWTTWRPLHATRLAASALSQLPVWLLAATVEAPARGLLLVGQATVLAAVASLADIVRLERLVHRGAAVRLHRLRVPAEVQALVIPGAAMAWLAGTVAGAVDAASGSSSTLARGVFVLLAAAAVAAAAAAVVRSVLPREVAAAAAVLTVLGTVALVAARTDPAAAYVPVVVVAAAASVIAALLALPRHRRLGGVGAATATAGLATLIDVAGLAHAVLGPFGWVGPARWSVELPVGAVRAVTPGAAWLGGVADLSLGVAATVVAVLATRALTDTWQLPGRAAAAGAVLLLPVSALVMDLPLAVTACGGVLVGGALVVAGAGRSRLTVLVAGTWVLVQFLAWSAASEATTLASLPLAVGALVCAGLVARADLRPAFVALVVLLLGLDVAAVTDAVEAPAGRAGFLVAAVAVTVVMVTSVLAARLTPADRLAAELAAAAVALGGVVLASGDRGWMAHTLTAAGVTATGMAVRGDRRELRYVSAALLLLASGARWGAGSDWPVEAHVAGPAVVLVALGALTRRERARAGMPVPSSWTAYGSGLGLGLVPSLFAAVGDDTLTRPLLLGLVALSIVLLGARLRLQAPLVVAATVLAIDTVVQLAPYADVLPRWVTFGAIGLLLLGVGATYERRLDDARQVRSRIAALR